MRMRPVGYAGRDPSGIPRPQRVREAVADGRLRRARDAHAPQCEEETSDHGNRAVGRGTGQLDYQADYRPLLKKYRALCLKYRARSDAAERERVRAVSELASAAAHQMNNVLHAMALRVDGAHFGELLNPHGGQSDLAARVVRVLHPGSFVDDPTRLFRAARYEQRLGFSLAPETLALIPGAWEALAALTGDRVRREFELIFREPRAVAMLARLAGLEVLPCVHPALRWGEREAVRAAVIPDLPKSDWRLASPLEPDALYFALMLGAASPVEVTGALTRLNTNGGVSRAVVEGLHLRVAWTRPSEAVAILGELSELGVVVAYVLHEGARAALNDYLARWRFVRAETTGDDLIARGLTPGPQFKRLLWELRAARLDGVITDVAGEQELIRRWLTETKP